jgi:hypothetical protein
VGCTHVLQRSQLLTPLVAPLVLLCYKTADKSWMRKGPDCYYDKQWSFVTQILHNGYQSYVVERKTFEVLTSSWTLGTLGSVASLLEATLGQGNYDRNHKLSNIGSSKKLYPSRAQESTLRFLVGAVLLDVLVFHVVLCCVFYLVSSCILYTQHYQLLWIVIHNCHIGFANVFFSTWRTHFFLVMSSSRYERPVNRRFSDSYRICDKRHNWFMGNLISQ